MNQEMLLMLGLLWLLSRNKGASADAAHRRAAATAPARPVPGAAPHPLVSVKK